MMERRIIEIDDERCNGCGICADACHEGAIGIVDGKAKLLRDDYCDGLGDCLPACPQNAIAFVEREAAAYDEAAAAQHKSANSQPAPAFTCPGSRAQSFARGIDAPAAPAAAGGIGAAAPNASDAQAALAAPTPQTVPSQLRQWPVQIKLTATKASCFDGAHLLVAADCTAYAYGNFHHDFMRGKATLIGCPKLDAVDYSEKLTAIIRDNDIKDVTILRMEVPCCGGLEQAVKNALRNSGKFIPWQVVTISTDGQILD